jgi:hypothetical protein
VWTPGLRGCRDEDRWLVGEFGVRGCCELELDAELGRALEGRWIGAGDGRLMVPSVWVL